MYALQNQSPQHTKPPHRYNPGNFLASMYLFRLTGFETVGTSLHHEQASQAKVSIYCLNFVMEEGATTTRLNAIGRDPNLKARLRTSMFVFKLCSGSL